MKTKLLFLLLFSAFSVVAQKTDTLFVKSGDIKLHAVLTKPADEATKTLVLIIAGSGPTDLNGNNPMMQNNSLRLLSEGLVEKGIATLRFDKRGIAKSAFEGFKESDLTFDTYAQDVENLVEYGRSQGFSRIFIAGHSEGSLIGMIAANNTEVSGFISLCGAGSSIDEVLKKQLQPRLTDTLMAQTNIILDSLKQGHQVRNIPGQLQMLFRPSVQPYLISWLAYDPAQLIGTLDCPVLIIEGTKDIQVDQAEGQKLRQGAPDAQFTSIENMNHVLKEIDGDIQANMASYNNPDLSLHPALVERLVRFIREVE